MANYMAEVAKMLDVKLGEEFQIVVNGKATVKLTEDGLEIVTIIGKLIDNAEHICLTKLLTGRYEIKRRPLKLKKNDFYWNVRLDGEPVLTRWLDDIIDLNNYKLGNCYRTKVEAEQNRDKWIAFYASDEVLEV